MKINQFTRMKNLFLWMFVFGVYCNASAQMDARLFQYPDISDEHIVFTYGGDLWTVDKMGGTAAKLTTATGTESRAKISPDGRMVSYTANYDGNSDIYTIPIGGGIPKRVTRHGMFDRNLDWMPDGTSLLYASSMHSEKQRFSKFFKISAEGGLPEQMPMAYGEYISLSPDGKMAAFTDKSRLARSWKRYRGGMAADIFVFDLEKLESKNITNNPANDEIPMWIGSKIYYLSDKGSFSRYNLWEYDPETSNHTQLTEFQDYDVHLPSSGGNAIVFEAGGKLHVYDIASKALREVDIKVGADMTSIKPRKEKVHDLLQSASIAPDGKRVIASARGDLFSLPTEEGYVQNLSRSSGVAERYPAWAPNGKYIAF